ncbi:alternative oxidase [Colletotrichum musicola]|uniref:Alternative oxidase n=1 Tax=Colletotrichum musicola TaxID=2175873 RepID=A0A8H6JS73_9PEZI|nr:alternative oxidase [Colletotrichum musicola]
MGLKVMYRGRRLGRFSKAVIVAAAFVLLWIFREPLRLDRVGLDDSLVPWRPRPPQDAFDFPPLDSDAIRAVCDATAWDANTNTQVVFTCDNNIGGIGDVRNSVLNCVRYAMLAGGSLVMPRIFTRNESTARADKRAGLEYMFDRDHFVESLRLSCPQLRLFDNTDEAYETLGAPRTWPLGLFPESLIEEEKIPSTGIPRPETWKSLLYAWLNVVDESIDVAPTGSRIEGPIIVDFGRSYLTYPIQSDGEAFASTFGNLLKVRADVRQLATTVVQSIDQLFFGAHLWTQKEGVDSLKPVDPNWDWSEYSRQIDVYLDQASRWDISLVYAASADATRLAAFAADAREKRGMAVVNNADLLHGKEKAQLEALSMDQQAMVDFLVMMGAAQFGGVGHSSFAWNVALKRHLFVQEPGKYLDGPQMLSDDLSQVYGTRGKYPEYAACLWP